MSLARGGSALLGAMRCSDVAAEYTERSARARMRIGIKARLEFRSEKREAA